MTATTKLRTRSLILGALLLTAIFAVPAQAQDRAFGTAQTSTHVLSAYDFSLFSSSSTYSGNSFGSRYCNSNDCFFLAGLMIPSGSRIEAIALDACDASSVDADVRLFRVPNNEGTRVTLASATTTGTSGCQLPSASLAAPETVDNLNNNYLIEVDITDSGAALRFQAVRVTHRRQISPAPGTATFSDVSTGHQFFQEIEALAASGITLGCGGGNYCPDATVTRSQMAAFLARGLGLHFPN